jgi:microsomal dipeptidase-like Zn-dependent dipeptidase
MLTALAFVQRWPYDAWSSPKERALLQATNLHELALRSGGRFRVIETRGDLRRFEADRRTVPSLVAGVLAIEGLHAIEGDIVNVDVLRDAGYRMMGIAHFFDNEVGGSVHGERKGGLTDLGRAVVAKMQSTNIIVDLAHASAKVIDDVLAMSTRPVIVSHTGVRGTCEHVRNLSDDQLRGVAATGGLIGIGYWDAAVCETTVASIVRALVYTAKVVGAEHVALGSDYDGSTRVPFDTTGVPMLTQGLLDAGLAPDDVRKIMGENVQRVLQQTLP